MKKSGKEQLELLVESAKNGDENAKEYLVKRFQPLIRKRIQEIYIKTYDYEDLMQIGNISVLKAIQKYDIDRNNFTAYVKASIDNNFKYEIRKASKKRYEISLEKVIEDKMELLNNMVVNVDIENKIIIEEEKGKVISALEKLKSTEYKLIFNLYFNEISKKQISKNSKMKYATIYKRENRSLKKLRNILIHEKMNSLI